MPDYCTTRRQFLQSIALSTFFAKGAFTGIALAQSVEAASTVIDVHCHVFNASDLPVHGFLQRVVFGDEEDQVVFDPDPGRSRALVPWVGASLARLMLNAPDAASELRALRRQPRLVASADYDSVAEFRVERLRRALQETFEPESQPPTKFRGMAPDNDLQRGRELLRGKIAEEAGVGPKPRSLDPSERPLEPEARGLLSGYGTLARHYRWADLLTSYRVTIVKRLIGLYPEITLFVPALIDFSAWLDDEPRSTLEEQIALMEHIQRLNLGTPIHCMAPFDPWRQISDEETGRSPSAFELVESAVMEKGFVGIKLYPPMGFLPTGNAASGLPYPKRAEAIRDFPKRLDDALERLYAWAAKHDVPIMAHATNSNGAGEGYAARAHPGGWVEVLRRYPRLRLNLAHFGGFNETATPGAIDNTWEASVAALISSGAPGLYADTSYLHEFLPGVGEPARLDLMRQNFKVFKQRFDPGLERLMYGSDWNMLAREKDHDKYLTVNQDLMGEIGASRLERRRFFSMNAVRFLGLNQDAKPRQRLEAYYRRHGLDPDWLTRLDDA